MRRLPVSGDAQMEEIEDTIDDEETDETPDGDRPAGAAPAAAAGDGEGEDVESIQDLLVKQEAGEEEEEAEDSVLTLTRDELRDESMAVKVVPPQANEFTCRKCYLVKHRSQLKDKTKMLCRDCA